MSKDDDLDEFGLHEPRPVAAPTAPDVPAALGRADDILGKLAFQAALAARLAKRTPIIHKIAPGKARRWTIGFGPQPVPPHGRATVSSQPRCLFRGEKIINTGDPDIRVDGLFVGRKSQFPPGPVPMSVFHANALDSEIKLNTCDPALMMTWQVQNPTAATLTFSCSIIGKAVL